MGDRDSDRSMAGIPVDASPYYRKIAQICVDFRRMGATETFLPIRMKFCMEGKGIRWVHSHIPF